MSDTLKSALRYGEQCKRLVDVGLENANEQITAALFDEITRLRDELAEAKEPDCRACAFYYACIIGQNEICIAGTGFDYARDPVRLYEKEGK